MRLESILTGFMDFPSSYTVPKVGGEHPRNVDEKGSEHNESLAQSAHNIRHPTREQALGKRDLDGDGVVSQAEAIKSANKPSLSSGDGASTANGIQGLALGGLDLNGDGVVSQAEAIENASRFNIAKTPHQDKAAIEKESAQEGLGLSGDGDHLSVLA